MSRRGTIFRRDFSSHTSANPLLKKSTSAIVTTPSVKITSGRFVDVSLKGSECLVIYRGVFLLCVVSFLLTPFSFSGSRNIHFERLLPEQGLSSGVILSIIQDHKGYMWFGTLEGLNRYDGYNFKVFKSFARDSNALSRDYITALVEDSSQVLWIGTTGGLHRYDRDRQVFKRYERTVDGKPTAELNRISAMALDHRQHLWLATYGQGLCRFNKEKGEFLSYVHDSTNQLSVSSDSIQALYVDHSGRLWVASQQGIDLFNPETGAFVRWSTMQPPRYRRALMKVSSMREDGEGNFWFVTDGEGLLQCDRQGTWNAYIPEWISKKPKSRVLMSTILAGTDGQLWIGSEFDGLLRFNTASKKFDRFTNNPNNLASLSGTSVTTLYQDRSGILWVGTRDGLNKLDSKAKKFSHHTFDFHDETFRMYNNVRSICQDDDQWLWVGTAGKNNDPGLLRYHPLQGEFNRVRLSQGGVNHIFPSVYSMTKDPGGTLWIATYGRGFYELNPMTLHLENFRPGRNNPNAIASDFIRCVFVDHEWKVWVAPRGMPPQVYDPATRRFSSLAGFPGEPIAAGAENILTIYEDSRRDMWFGTLGSGLFKYDRYSKRFTRYGYDPSDSTSLSYDVVTVIHQDRAGTLWVGTTEGLNKFKPATATFTQYTEREGLPGASVYGILEDNNGRLWISTDHGIACLDDRLPAGQKFRSFELSDGLQGYEFNKGAYYKGAGGEMFFGGTNGINSFYPDRLDDNPFIPPIVITSFKKFSKEVALPRAIDEADTVEVMYRDNTISFDLAALEFTNPFRNQYAYRLEGFDKDWTYTARGEHSVTYTNLDPNTYVLRVKASNNDGVWNERGISLAVVVVPPFWMTWWYRLIMAAILVAAAGMYLRRRELRHHEARRAQEEFSRRLIASQEGERKRIAIELHDSLGQNIMVMKNKALLALQGMEAESFKATQLQDISSIASQTLDEARRIAYNLRPYQLDRFGLSEAIRFMLEEISRTSGIECNCTVDEVDGIFSKESEINIYRVVQESVNNIVKHSGATHTRVAVKRTDSEVMLEIRDNGKGLAAAAGSEHVHGQSGMGLLGIQERVKLLAGTFSIHSVPGIGTKIIISLPIGETPA